MNSVFDEDSGSSIILRSAGADEGQKLSTKKKRNVLLIEDSVSDFQLLKVYLGMSPDVEFVVEHAVRLADGLLRLVDGGIHLVLLDLTLPDSAGLETFRKLHSHASNVPVIVISGVQDESLAVRAVSEGAADFLLKEKLNSDTLLRAINHARTRHKAQAELTRVLQLAQASEINLRNIIINNPDGMLVVDVEGFVIFSNPAAHVLFSRSAEELQRERFGLPLMSGEATEVELLRNGVAVPVQLRVVNVDWEDNRAHLAILHDLTERKQAEAALRASEEQFRSIAQTASDAIVLSDGTSTILSWNPGAQATFGYSEGSCPILGMESGPDSGSGI